MEVIINELALELIRQVLKDRAREVFGEVDADCTIPLMTKIIDNAFKDQSQRRIETIFGNEIIDVDPVTGEVKDTPLLPSIINNILSEKDGNLIALNEDGQRIGFNAVTEHRPFATTNIEDYNVSEGLLLVLVTIMFINLIRGFFGRVA
jgi:hypothetical protein